MAGRDDRTLEKRINEITKGLAIEQLGTTSDPLSYQINCYQKLGERACATTAINLLAGTANQFVCTDEQASELEKLELRVPYSRVGFFANLAPSRLRARVTADRGLFAEALRLESVADFYDRELTKRIAVLTRLAEPVMLLVMGSVVGVIVASLILPIFKLSRAVH